MINPKLQIDTNLLKSITKSQLKKQGTFAMANALTSIAFKARASTQKQLPHWLKLTKKFIPSSVVVDKADKRNLTATVGFLKRVNLIDLMEIGGTRRPTTTRTLAIPFNVKRTSKGGISKANRPRKLLQKKNVFSGVVKGVAGIWQRSGSKRNGYKLKLLYGYEKKVKYDKKTVNFVDLVTKVLNRNMTKVYEQQLTRAIKSMRK